MFLFLLIATPILIASVYLLLHDKKPAATSGAQNQKKNAGQGLTRNGFTNTADEFNYQHNLKKINLEKIEFAKLEAKKSAEQKKEDEEREEKGRIALIELARLAQRAKEKKKELELVIENPKPANAALDFFINLEKPQENEVNEIETEAGNTIAESIIGGVLGSAIGLPAPVFELVSTLNDAVNDDPKPTNSMPSRRKRM